MDGREQAPGRHRVDGNDLPLVEHYGRSDCASLGAWYWG